MSCLGILAGTWDIMWQLQEEMALLSSLLYEVNIIKILYVATRYSPFLIHGVSIVFVSRIQNYVPHTPKHICQFWLLFATSTCEWMLILITINLMLRVYALYNRSPYVVAVLISLLLCKILIVLLVWMAVIRNPQQEFTPHCDPMLRPSLFTALFSLSELLTEGIPVWLILRRSSRLLSFMRENAAGTKRLVASVRRGGMLTWLAVVSFAVIENAVSVYRRDKGTETQQIFFPLFISLASHGGCQLILQLRRPGSASTSRTDQEPDSSQHPPGFELDTYDSAWDAQTIVERQEQPAEEPHP